NGGKNSLNRLIRCVCGKKIGPDPRNFNQRVNLGRNDLLIRTFPKGLELAINALNNQLTSQHQYPTNPSESESASSSDHYYFAIFWVFAVMFFPFWFFHQGSNFCRACKSGVCISAIYLLDLFLFSDKIFSIAVFSFFFTFTIFMVFTCLCVLQKRASGRSYHSDNSGSAGGSDSGGFSGGGGSSGGGGASGRW
ncbi:hypothetical protein NGH12_13745, partial [Escherichia coli]|nr:hypothetical protein [Escherichia coli]